MSWQTPENLSADGIVDLFTGTPDGTLFLRDDGTLAAPSGGGTDASALTTGTLAAARLPGVLANVDTQGELLSAAAAAPIASPTFTGTVTSPATTQTGALQFTGTQTSAGASVANIFRDVNGNLVDNVATGTFHWHAVNGVNQVALSAHGVVFNNAAQTNLGASYANIFRDSTGDLNYNVDASDVHDFLVNATSQATIGASGVGFGTAHSAPATSVIGIWRGSSTTLVLQGPTTGYAQMCCNGSNAPMVQVCGSSASGGGSMPGQINLIGGAVSLADAANRIVVNSATTKSGFVEISDTTNGRVALYSVENGVTTKLSGHSQFVATAPGAGEVGVYLSGTAIIVDNNSGGALLLGAQPRIF